MFDSGSTKESYIKAALQTSEAKIGQLIRRKWSGYNMSGILESIPAIENVDVKDYPYKFLLRTGGSVEIAGFDKKGMFEKRTAIYRIVYQNSHGDQTSYPPCEIGGGLSLIANPNEKVKFSTEEKNGLIRALYMIDPKQDFVLDNVDWKDIPKMKLLGALGVEGSDLLWTDQMESPNSLVSKLMNINTFDVDKIYELFDHQKLKNVFESEIEPELKVRLIRFLQIFAANAPSPADVSVEDFYDLAKDHVWDLEHKPFDLKKVELTSDQKREMSNMMNFCIDSGFAIHREGKHGSRLILNPYVTNWVKRLFPEETE